MSIRRGWCPSLHEPMPTGDGLLVRVKPPLGILTAADALALAAAARRYGNGAIELTARAALQFRGLSTATAPAFAQVVVARGLACADPAAERRRSVLVSPLAGLDPSVSPAVATLAVALSAALVDDNGLAGLPAKFRFAVDGGGLLPLGATGADIGLRVAGETCTISLADGHIVVRVPAIDAPSAALRLAHALLQSPLPLAGEGWVRVGPKAESPVTSDAPPSPRPSPASGRGSDPVGFHVRAGAFGVGVPFGTLDAHRLDALAELASRHGDGTVRLTPWRTVLLPGLRSGTQAAALGFVVDPDDPALRVSACPGHPACAAASVATRDLAAALRPPPGATVHVSGCDKGCAHPGPATLTLVGRDGSFDLVRNGRARDLPARRALSPAEALHAR